MPRILRSQTPPRYYQTYRKYLSFLRIDFDDRCAYSMQHYTRAGGLTAMEIDHHNCNLPDAVRNNYDNLFLSTKHCNGHKLAKPSERDIRLGLRFLNPCIEDDYGTHIFEDPDTFELWGDTPEGRYHIRNLDLNAYHLILERKTRHAARTEWEKEGLVTTADPAADLDGTGVFLSSMKGEIDRMIPPIIQKKKPELPE